jgi:hypothetical protein
MSFLYLNFSSPCPLHFPFFRALKGAFGKLPFRSRKPEDYLPEQWQPLGAAGTANRKLQRFVRSSQKDRPRLKNQ